VAPDFALGSGLAIKKLFERARASGERSLARKISASSMVRFMISAGEPWISRRDAATASTGSAEISCAAFRTSSSTFSGGTTVLTRPTDFLGVERVAHDEKCKGASFAHKARRGRGEARIGWRDHIVEMRQHGHADADCNPLDPGDHRLLCMDQPAKETAHRRLQALHVLRRVKEIVEIAAGGKNILAHDRHAMDGLSVRRVVEGTCELVVHVLADRIFLVEAVHPHPPDRALIDDYHMLGHIGPIPAAAIRTLSEPSVTIYAKCGRHLRDIFVKGRPMVSMAEPAAGGRQS
jgi:hypothetical protein